MKGMKCVCGKIAQYNEHLKFNGYDIEGWECSCGEIYYHPEKAERILLLNRLQKTKYRLKLNRVKSNLILRIPKEVGEVLHLEGGDEVELGLKNAKEIIVHPLEA